jgi:quercetin dioxygenase-like cupin family protein
MAGPVWGLESEQLNATLLEWPPGGGPGSTLSQLDVLYVVVDGSIVITIDDAPRELVAGDGMIVPKGVRRSVVAGADGVRYVTAHRRRGPLQIPSTKNSPTLRAT